MSDFNPMSPCSEILTFDVVRETDVTGTSGDGVVAIGALFPDGTTVVQWQTHVRSVVIYGSYADALHIHGHGGNTGFRFHSNLDKIYYSDGSSISTEPLDRLVRTLDKARPSPMCHCDEYVFPHTEAFHTSTNSIYNKNTEEGAENGRSA